jgi:hypothetical protein
MRVTLDIYSGRENPAWELSPSDARQLVSRLAGRAVAAAEEAESVLGFRGYVIAVADDADDTATAAGLPHTFRIGGAPPQSFMSGEAETTPPLTGEEAYEAAQWLLTTAPEAVDPDLLSLVQGALRSTPAPPPQAQAPITAACVIQNTPYNPGFWNTPAAQPNNNCYNYAMNYRSDTFAQPGRISGHPNNVMQCANVATAANWDGCTATCSGPNKNVALVIWPGHDYHWYRLHSNGFWGHKPGGTAARNTDNRGRVIGGALNPANCDRGPYTIFCGYRFSPVGMRVR